MPTEFDETRRQLLTGSVGLATSLCGARSRAATEGGSPTHVDEGEVASGRLSFPAIDASTEQPGSPPPNPDIPGQRVGFAVMGLGRLALQNVLPAFAQCKHARLTGLVSGDPEKLRLIAAQYEVNNRELAKRARRGELGDIQFIDAVNTQNQGDPTQWRQIKNLSGGGSLPDVGL